MTIELNDGKIKAIPETEDDLKFIIKLLRKSGNRQILSFGLKKQKQSSKKVGSTSSIKEVDK